MPTLIRPIIRPLAQLLALACLLLAAALASPAHAVSPRAAQAAPQPSAQPQSAQPSARAERRVALVIGNGAYKEGPLKNPANDARDMAATLKGLGFEVILRENASLRQMNEAIDQFWTSLKKGGVGLFFFAGHGLQVGGENFLVPVDARVAVERDVQYECVNAGRILGRMEDAGNGLNIVILDACRNNPFARSFRSETRGLAKMDAPTGSLVAFATAPGDVAADGEGRNGLYTSHLLRQMRTPGRKVEDVLKQVRVGVTADSLRQGKKQTPWESSSLMGDFYFAGKPAPAAPAQPGQQALAPVPQAPPPAAPAPLPPAPPPSRPGETWRDPATGMEFVWAPGGAYDMGCGPWAGKCRPDEQPVHRVRVDGFWLGKFEVTQSQWQRVMGDNPAKFKKGDSHPVDQVSWTDAKEFIARLNSLGAAKFSLPTEAEWEYAARSGGKPELYAGGSSAGSLGWHKPNSGESTHEVGGKAPNGLGLHDMSGNVWEFCEDVYVNKAYAAHAPDNPLNTSGLPLVIIRGGAWFNDPEYLRTAHRGNLSPHLRRDYVGLRLVRTN